MGRETHGTGTESFLVKGNPIGSTKHGIFFYEVQVVSMPEQGTSDNGQFLIGFGKDNVKLFNGENNPSSFFRCFVTDDMLLKYNDTSEKTFPYVLGDIIRCEYNSVDYIISFFLNGRKIGTEFCIRRESKRLFNSMYETVRHWAQACNSFFWC